MRRLIGIALVFVLVAGPSARAGDIGKDIERGLGKMVADELESSYGVVDDPLLTNWVDRVGQRLAAVSGRTDVKYRFRVLDSDDVNAVAAPGGYVYVNRGTLSFVRSEDELAAVMGHEVGHVAGKHAMKQLTAQLLGTLALVGFQAAHANTLSTAGSLAGGLAMLKFGRDEENDADRRGLRNAVATGYDGTAMLTFFRRLQETEKDKPNGFEVYFLNHPPTPERIKRVSKEPGTAETAANFTALGQGLADRSLFRAAAAAYKRALELDPGNAEIKARISDAARNAPAIAAQPKLNPTTRDEKLKQLAGFQQELDSTRDQIYSDRTQLANAQKAADDELESAARSLTNASQMISRRDVVQYREFVRMARAFDRATRAGANLRAARDLSDDCLIELSRLSATMRSDIENGDAAAGSQVDGLLMAGHSMLVDLSNGIKLARGRAGDAKDGARSLRNAADSLMMSYRSPFGYTTGQYSILDSQVGTAQDTLNEVVNSTRRATGMIAHSRTMLLVTRINYLTRAIKPNDSATSGIIAHYLGVDSADVKSRRQTLAFGDAALALADDEIEKYRDAKRKEKKDSKETARRNPESSLKDQAVRDGLKWENAGVLFKLIANDISRETKSF